MRSPHTSILHYSVFNIHYSLRQIAPLPVVWGGARFVWNLLFFAFEGADTLNDLMAIPNFIALFALSPVVFRVTKDYFKEVDTLEGKKQ